MSFIVRFQLQNLRNSFSIYEVNASGVYKSLKKCIDFFGAPGISARKWMDEWTAGGF